MLIAFLSYKEQFAARFNGLVDGFLQYRMLSIQLDRVGDIVLSEQEFRGDTRELSDQQVKGHISAKNVSFRFDSYSPWILNNLNFDIEAGSHVAILAPSGAGKTTLMKLMIGFLSPVEGRVEFDGLDMAKFRKAIQSHIATVMQDDVLLSGNIAENIALFDLNPNMDRIVNAAKIAQIHDEIESMSMRYQSLIGDMGSSLSGGQKQRILIARALYRNPKILFMDEATSHLDVACEREINSAIGDLCITRIIIAHRPETILSAKRIYSLRKGELIPISHSEYIQSIESDK